MKKIVSFIMIILFVCFMNSCGAGENRAPNGDANGPTQYTSYKEITYEDVKYQISNIQNIDFIDQFGSNYREGLIYYVTEYEFVNEDNITNWSINYKYDNSRINKSNRLDQDFISYIYTILETSILSYGIMFDVELEYYENLYDISKEFNVSMEYEYSKVVVIDIYLPYQITNYNTNQIDYVNVPIMSILGYYQEDNLMILCNDSSFTINYTSFLNSYNVFK